MDLAVQDGHDAAVFAYLDDVDPTSGEATYISEGNVRAGNARIENVGKSQSCMVSRF